MGGGGGSFFAGAVPLELEDYRGDQLAGCSFPVQAYPTYRIAPKALEKRAHYWQQKG